MNELCSVRELPASGLLEPPIPSITQELERLHALLGLRTGSKLENLLLNDQETITFGDRYKFLRIIGQGAFGVVLHVVKKTMTNELKEDKSTHRALKIISKPGNRQTKVPIPDQYELIRSEALILQQL